MEKDDDDGPLTKRGLVPHHIIIIIWRSDAVKRFEIEGVRGRAAQLIWKMRLNQ